MKSKYSQFLLPILLIAGALLTGVTFLGPKIIQVATTKKRITQEKEKLGMLTQKVFVLESLDESTLTKKTELVLKALPVEKDISKILFTLKKLAAQQECEVKAFAVKPGLISEPDLSNSKAESNFSALPLVLDLEGKTDKVKALLEQISNTLPLMRVEKISSKFDKNGYTKATLEIDFFFLNLPTSLGAAETPIAPLTSEEENIYGKIANFKVIEEEKEFPPVSGGRENPFVF